MYYFKPSKVKGKIYMQIWKKEGTNRSYVLTIGCAESAYKVFSNLEKLMKDGQLNLD